MILQLRHFLCCERVQRESHTHTLGSMLPFSAPQHRCAQPNCVLSLLGPKRTLAEFHCAARSFPEADIGKGVQHSDDRTAAVQDKTAVRGFDINCRFLYFATSRGSVNQAVGRRLFS